MFLDRPTGFDSFVDRRLERLRGVKPLDIGASVLSALGDWGLVWFLIAIARSRDPVARRGALRAVVFTGALAPLVNVLVKHYAGRSRPPRSAPGQMTSPARLVRSPRSSSFPSGHTLAACCATTLLADAGSRRWTLVVLSAGIAWSRVHLRHHHATDVIGGALIGTAMGLAGRWVWPLAPRQGTLPRTSPSPTPILQG